MKHLSLSTHPNIIGKTGYVSLKNVCRRSVLHPGLPVDKNMKIQIRDCGYCVMMHTDQCVKDKNLAVKCGKNIKRLLHPFIQTLIVKLRMYYFCPIWPSLHIEINWLWWTIWNHLNVIFKQRILLSLQDVLLDLIVQKKYFMCVVLNRWWSKKCYETILISSSKCVIRHAVTTYEQEV